MGTVPKRKTERAPAVDRLIKPAGGVGLALLAYFILQGLQAEVSFFRKTMSLKEGDKKTFIQMKDAVYALC